MDRKFAIFDMDGTLVDSMSYWSGLGGEFVQARGLPTTTPAQREEMKTMTMPESSAYLVREYGLDCTPEAAAEEMTFRMAEHYRKDIPLKPGVAAYLKKLHAAGVTMSVASATGRPLILACLERLGVAGYFSVVLSCEDVGVGKSQPDVYLEAARRMGACPAETAVYEDALLAVNTAKDADFYVVGVFDESGRPQWEELTARADEVILDFCAE